MNNVFLCALFRQFIRICSNGEFRIKNLELRIKNLEFRIKNLELKRLMGIAHIVIRSMFLFVLAGLCEIGVVIEFGYPFGRLDCSFGGFGDW